MFLSRKKKNIRVFLFENFQILDVKFSIYLIRCVFIMSTLFDTVWDFMQLHVEDILKNKTNWIYDFLVWNTSGKVAMIGNVHSKTPDKDSLEVRTQNSTHTFGSGSKYREYAIIWSISLAMFTWWSLLCEHNANSTVVEHLENIPI